MSELKIMMLAVQENENIYNEETIEVTSKEIESSSELPKSVKDVTKQHTFKCQYCNYSCEKNVFLIKHVNTNHGEKFKCHQCGELVKDNNAMEAHKRIQHEPEVAKKNVNCDKCNSQFTSKMSLSQHMFTTYTPTRIEETGIFCNLCGEEFWTELDMINHLKEHMTGSQTDEPFFCKLCGIGISDKNAINQHMINHVEDVLKEDFEAKESQMKLFRNLILSQRMKKKLFQKKSLTKKKKTILKAS